MRVNMKELKGIYICSIFFWGMEGVPYKVMGTPKNNQGYTPIKFWGKYKNLI